MNRMERYLISIWRNQDPEAETECIALPPDEFGSVSATVDGLRDELKDLQADGLIDRFTVVEQPCDDITPSEAHNWLADIREEQQ